MNKTKKKGTKTFVLNDESITNSYGFRVSNGALDLERFISNPVMLGQHIWDSVAGKWTNIRIEGTKLLADSDFDLDDPDAEKLAGKVERGYVNGASLGFWRDSTPLNLTKEGYLPYGESPLFGGEVYESSVVSVPSNAGALSVKLYAKGGGQLQDGETVSLSAFSQYYKPLENENLNQNSMTELERHDYESRIQELTAENNALKETKAKEQRKQVEVTLAEYPKLTNQQRESFRALGEKLGVDQLCAALSAIQPSVSLAGMVENKGGYNGKPKTYSELCAMGKDKLDFYIQHEPEFVNKLIAKS